MTTTTRQQHPGNTIRPKIKRDLQFFPIGEGVYHVFDPSTVSHFKMGHQEVTWLRLLDGTRSKETLRDHIPHEYFERFLGNTARLSLLEGQKPSKRRDWFRISLPLINPNPYLIRMGRLPHLYKTSLNRLSIFLLIFNAAGVTHLRETVANSLASIHFSLSVLLFYIAATLVMGFFHEVSHALVARSQGVNVPVLGIMLFYLHPAFYADVSGIRLIPGRGSRINVLLSGVMANNMLISISLLLYSALTGPLREYCLYFVWMNVIIVFVNLIPFVEYDGHYVFQELLNEPDLTVQARKSIRQVMPRRVEHAVYYLLSKAFSLALIVSAVLVLRRGMLRVASPGYVNCICLISIITAAVLSGRRAGSVKPSRS